MFQRGLNKHIFILEPDGTKVELAPGLQEKLKCSCFTIKAIEHSMYISGFSCTPVASISVISVVLSGYRCVPLFTHSRLLL